MKKGLLVIGLAAAIGLAGCGSEAPAPAAEATTETETWSSWEYEGVSVDIPDSWKYGEEQSNENFKYYYPDDGMFMISIDDPFEINDENFKEYVNGMEGTEGITVDDSEIYNFRGDSAIHVNMTYEGDGLTQKMESIVININNKQLGFTISSPKEGKYQTEFTKIMNSITITEPAEATTEETTEATTEPEPEATTEATTEPEPEETTEAEPEATTGQLNALDKAQDYLSFTAFSKKGLRSQLEYEGFKDDEIDYAIENCGADWKEQAVKKAKEYLEFSSFSKESLIEQLEYEGFTEKQAKYGADEAYK